MTSSIEWTFLLTRSNDDKKIVEQVHWQAWIMTEEGERFKGCVGATLLPKPPAKGFIAYDKLDQATILDWLVQVEGDTFIKDREAAALERYERHQHPPSVTEPL